MFLMYICRWLYYNEWIVVIGIKYVNLVLVLDILFMLKFVFYDF